MQIYPLIDPYAVHFDSFAGDVYTLDTAGITLTAGTLTANTLTDGTATLTGGDYSSTGTIGAGAITSTSLDATAGLIQTTGNINVNSNSNKFQAGTGQELTIGYDGSDGRIVFTGADDLVLDATGATDGDIVLESKDDIFLNAGDKVHLNYNVTGSVNCFANSGNGDNQVFNIYGYQNGVGAKYTSINIDIYGRLSFGGTATGTMFNTKIVSDKHLVFPDTEVMGLGYNEDQTNDMAYIGVKEAAGGLLICEYTDRAYDFAHGVSADPTIWLHSHNQATDEWLSLLHNATDGNIQTGKGDLNLIPFGSVTLGDGGTTDYTAISAIGFQQMYGSAIVWDDLQFAVSTGKVTPASGEPMWETFTTNTKEYAFDVDDYIDLQANELPHWWKEGTAGNMHVHFAIKSEQVDGGSASQYVKFSVWVAYVDANADEVWVEQAVLGGEKEIAFGASALTQFYVDCGDATLTNYLIGGQVKVRVKRIAATTGTEYADDVYITQVGMHLQKNTLGSSSELTK